TLTPQQAFSRGRLTYELFDAETALPNARAAVAAAPGSPMAHFLLGLVLLDLQDPAGVHEMEGVMLAQPARAIQALEPLYRYFVRTGQQAAAEATLQRLREQQALINRAHDERQQLKPSEQLASHLLTPEQIAAIVAQLQRVPHLKAVYVGRKIVTLVPDSPCLVVGVVADSAWFRLAAPDAGAQVTRRVILEVDWPMEAVGVSLEARYLPLLKSLRQMPGACIYEAPRR
ncbi:MAG: hypothetical protein ABI743_14965, partial [bacterium]